MAKLNNTIFLGMTLLIISFSGVLGGCYTSAQANDDRILELASEEQVAVAQQYIDSCSQQFGEQECPDVARALVITGQVVDERGERLAERAERFAANRCSRMRAMLRSRTYVQSGRSLYDGWRSYYRYCN